MPRRRQRTIAGAVFAAVLAFATHTSAQVPMVVTQGLQGQPEPLLGSLIAAFQNCGPPPAFQVLGPSIFQTIWMQTNGSGCYAAVQQLGQLRQIEVLQRGQLPAGPVYLMRSRYVNGIG